PDDERRRLPAGLVVVGERRQPFVEEGDPFPVAPPALLVRQGHLVIDLDGDGFAGPDRPGQRHDEGGVRLLPVIGGDRLALASDGDDVAGAARGGHGGGGGPGGQRDRLGGPP